MTGELAARRLPARTHAGPAPGFSAFTPGGGEEGEPRPHCREEEEEEDVEEGGREEARRPGAGGGGLATFSPPRERPRCTPFASTTTRWISSVLEERENNVPAPVEMICSSAQLKLTE